MSEEKMASIPLRDLLADEHVTMLIRAAQQAHKALTSRVSLSEEKRMAENLRLVLEIFTVDEMPETDTVRKLKAAADVSGVRNVGGGAV